MDSGASHSASRRRAIRAIVTFLVALPLILALSASSTSRAATSRDDQITSNAPLDLPHAQQPGPDLCALLQQVAGGEPLNLSPGVGKPGSDYQCTTGMRNNADMTLTNFGVDQARAQVDLRKSRSGGWVPNALGDSGYGYESPAHYHETNGWSAIYLMYARGCYFVEGSGGKDRDTGKPSDTPSIPAISAALDSVLQQPPYSDCGAPKIDLSIDHVEVVQVVQDAANSVPLVAHKKTLVRVFVKVQGTSSPVADVSASIITTSDAGTVSLSPDFGPITAPLTIDRTEPGHSINFILPPELTTAGSHSFQITLNPHTTITESDYSNNIHTEDATFTTMPTFRIGYVRVGYKPPGATDFAWPTGPIQDYAGLLHAMYPMADGEEGLKYYQEPFEIHVTRTITTEQDYLNLVWSVRTLYNLMSADRPDQLIAWVPEGLGTDIEGVAEPVVEHDDLIPNLGDLPRVVVARDRPTFQEESQDTLAHELGHNLGLKHTATHDPAPCQFADNDEPKYWEYQDDKGTIHEIGYDSRNGAILSPGNYDVMTYCNPSRKWISPFHYKGLFKGKLQARAVNPFSAMVFMTVRGTIKADKTGGSIIARRIPAPGGGTSINQKAGSISPSNSSNSFLAQSVSGFLPLTNISGNASQAPVTQGSGNYCLRFTGSDGSNLYQQCMDLDFRDHKTGAPLDEAEFVTALPFPEGATHLALLDRGREIASLSASSSPPTVAINSPRAGDTWEGMQTITWSATNPGGGDMLYDVLYSANGGKSWFPISIDQAETTFEFNTASIAPGDQTYFRVLASSGLDTAIANIGPVIVPKQIGSPELPPPPPGGETVAGPGTTVAPVGTTDSSLLYIIGGGVLLVLAAGVGVFVVMGAGKKKLATQTAPPPYAVPPPPYSNAPQYPPQQSPGQNPPQQYAPTQYPPQQSPAYQGYAPVPPQPLPQRGSRVPLILILLLVAVGAVVTAGFVLGWKLPAIGGNSSSTGGTTQPTVVTGSLDTREYLLSLDDLPVGDSSVKDSIAGSGELVRFLGVEARPYEDPNGAGASTQSVAVKVAMLDGENKVDAGIWLVTSQEMVDTLQQSFSGTSNARARVELAQPGKTYEMTNPEGWLLKVTVNSMSLDENAILADGSPSPYPVFTELNLEVELTPR